MDKEDFYDCQDTLEISDERDIAEEEIQQDADRLNGSHIRHDVRWGNERGRRQQDKEHGDDGLRDDGLRDDGLRDDGLRDNSDLDMKEDNGQELEFDDDYLREVEKELTEQEKEVTSLPPHLCMF